MSFAWSYQLLWGGELMDVVEEAEKDLGVTRPHPEQEQELSL